ncbi:MAG: xanthine dehydrogenase molybdopterin binding subunit, partial [Polaromonas sp.]|nr:xanthine dehydrogenase molybdopterin binding subunit [Polaromonas sp.]
MNARDKTQNEGPVSRADNPSAPQVQLTPVTPPPGANAPARGAAGRSHKHESARAQVAGAATYVDDIGEVRGTLHAAPILSTVAHGRLRGVDASVALAMPGVRDVILARDVPADPLLATFVHDEPVFAIDKVEHIG